MASETDQKSKPESLASAVAFVEGGIVNAYDDACVICLEAFCQSDPSTDTSVYKQPTLSDRAMDSRTSHVSDEAATEWEFTTHSDSSYSSMEEDNPEEEHRELREQAKNQDKPIQNTQAHEPTLHLQLQHQPHSKQKEITRLITGITKNMKKMEDICGAKGFSFLVAFPGGDAASGCSDSTRSWFEGDKVMERAVEAVQSYKPDGLYAAPEAHHVRELLHLPKVILDSLLSELMQHCDPPQGIYPTSKFVRPPWWPRGHEEVWQELGVAQSGQKVEVMYTKPHNLEKVVKAGVLVTVVRHLAPAFDKVLQHTSRSQHLQDQMAPMEAATWKHVIDHEARRYYRLHPDAPFRKRLAVPKVAFTCNQPRCSYGHPARGFKTRRDLEMHRIVCSVRGTGAPGGASLGGQLRSQEIAAKQQPAVPTRPGVSNMPGPSETNHLHGMSQLGCGKEVAQHRGFDLNVSPPAEPTVHHQLSSSVSSTANTFFPPLSTLSSSNSGGSGSASGKSSFGNTGTTGVDASNPSLMNCTGGDFGFGASNLGGGGLGAPNNPTFVCAHAVRHNAPNPPTMNFLGGGYRFGGITTNSSPENLGVSLTNATVAGQDRNVNQGRAQLAKLSASNTPNLGIEQSGIGGTPQNPSGRSS